MWWSTLLAAETLGVAPWELEAQPIKWHRAALIRRGIEAELAEMRDRSARSRR